MPKRVASAGLYSAKIKVTSKSNRRPSVLSSEEIDSSYDYSHPNSFGFLIRYITRGFQRFFDMRLAEYDISFSHWTYLRALWEEDGLTQRELSARVGLVDPTTNFALKRMEQRGLIRRVRDEKDRRKMQVYLTEKGWRLQPILLPYAREANEMALARISQKDVLTARRVLLAVIHNIYDEVDLERPALLLRAERELSSLDSSVQSTNKRGRF